MRDLQFEAVSGAASPQLFLYCSSAKRLKSAVLTCDQDKAGSRHPLLAITLSNVVIGSYEVSASAEGSRPIDRVTLRFTKIEFTYQRYDDQHNVDSNLKKSFTYDLTTAQNK